MTKRENIILVVMALAVAFAGYYFLVKGAKVKGRPVAHVARDTVGLEQTVIALGNDLAKTKISEPEEKIMILSAKEWPQDPFFKGKLPSEIAAEAEKAAADARARAAAGRAAADREKQRLEERLSWEKQILGTFTYNGFATMGGEKLAIINGIEYRIGDEPPPGGCIITHIESDRLVLKRTDGDNTVTLTIKE